ncbi:MAG TPA: DEAD/DEAH box helicase family protein [Polyangiaceae bacterium]|nr:DEAD/DEAH box helicase family protein [Polyangiaceae bacterium]
MAKAVGGPASAEEASSETVVMKPCWSEDLVVDGNYARQLLVPAESVKLAASGSPSTFTTRSGEVFRVVRERKSRPNERALFVPPRALLANYRVLADIEGCAWIGDRSRSRPEDVLTSLKDGFEFREEGSSNNQVGLRDPQIGALHTILGYWTTDPQEPATVVMPTGTGKTETMLAVYAHQRIARLLVLVPSDALRDQLARKFESYGVLQEFQVIAPQALRPIVGQLKHGLASRNSARSFAQGCNVVVTTPNALGASSGAAQGEFLETFTHLFVDEAHHLGARTWQSIRDQFSGRRVVQFTATPFREDGRHLKGKTIYAFPLREAQRQGYFSTIDYISVLGAGDTDAAIATTAVNRLRSDLQQGFDHIVMARVQRIGRAEELLALYSKLAPEFAAVVLHSNSTGRARHEALAAIRKRSSRVVVCVDMLGEGFDLPQLKIAAIHDAHKSLGVTLQFVGRFARGHSTLGPATVVVGRPNSSYDTRLHELYREDADWNKVIRNLSEQAVAEEQEVDEFDRAFSKRSDSLSPHMLEPKMSAVVYRTNARTWRINAVHAAFKEGQILGDISVNQRDRVAWFITRNTSPVRWGAAPDLTEVSYDLYVLYWDEKQKLLYINSSNTDGHHELLAKKVSGESVARIKGEAVYRAMSGISRLVPTNVGVLDSRSHARRFSMHVGADVSVGFPVTEQVTKTQTNIFASGFENGTRVSIGASLKGRIWSYRIARSLRHWVGWCDHIGGKLLNSSINIDSILRSFIRPESVDARPALVFLAVEWPWELFQSTTEETRVELGGSEWPIVDADLQIKTFGTTGAVAFDVSTPSWTVRYEATFTEAGIAYAAIGADANMKRSRESVPLSTFFRQVGLTFHLEGDALIVHPSTLLRPNRQLAPFDVTRIVALDWTGTDLRKESQGPDKDPASIQARVIEHLRAEPEWRIILDDDGSGEIADVVAIAATEHELRVLLVHCKYSATGKPAARIDDLYEVCGQAQKSARWGQSFSLMLEHLARRERKRARAGSTGFARGDARVLLSLQDRARALRPSFSIAIAQPGLSQRRVSRQQLELLASTEVYLSETHLAAFEVFSSP